MLGRPAILGQTIRVDLPKPTVEGITVVEGEVFEVYPDGIGLEISSHESVFVKQPFTYEVIRDAK